MNEPDFDEIDERFEEDYDEWGDEDASAETGDCMYCMGRGELEPGFKCRMCDGTGWRSENRLT